MALKQVKLNPNVNKMLEEISDKRKKNGEIISTKQAIIHEIVMKQYKKEFK